MRRMSEVLHAMANQHLHADGKKKCTRDGIFVDRDICCKDLWKVITVLHDVSKRSHLEVDIMINRFLCFDARSAKSGFSHYLFICWEFHALVKSSRSFILRQSLQNILFISNILSYVKTCIHRFLPLQHPPKRYALASIPKSSWPCQCWQRNGQLGMGIPLPWPA